jgi:ketosteroid isomerase-like protein
MSVLSPVDVVRRVFECRAAGDIRSLLALLDPDIRVQATADGAVVEGLPGVRALFGRESAAGPRVEVEAHRIESDGEDGVLVHGRIRVIGKGALSDSPGAWRFTVRGGRVSGIAPLGAEPPALRRVA